MTAVTLMQRLTAAPFVTLVLPGVGRAQASKSIKLNAPDLRRGLPFMETLSVKASAREWSDRELSLQDLSDLMWAANGINRPAEKKYTASSATNAHDVDLYVFLKDGAYVYDADSHALNLVRREDYRSRIVRAPPQDGASEPPTLLVLVSNSTRFGGGSSEQRYEWGALDAGIVSQIISLSCAATGLKTRPRASMDKATVREVLGLSDAHYVFLNHPVGYAK